MRNPGNAVKRKSVMSTTNYLKESEFGYWFTSPESSHAPGGNRLDMFINELPDSQYFNLKNIRLPVKSEGGIETLRIYHPWLYKHNYHACAGIVEMIDRKGGKEEAYILGGELTIQTHNSLTECTLISPAPILHVYTPDRMKMMFIEEIEILLAERRAAFSTNLSDYEHHLAHADPLNLYVACIHALTEKFGQMPHKEDPQILQFLNFIHTESNRLDDEELRPYLPTSLEEIL
jgi:hypothetical protein